MMTIEELEEKKKTLENELYKVKAALGQYTYNDLKETYGDKFSCKYCRYGALTCVGNEYNTCAKMNVYGPCSEYMPDSKLSSWIKEENMQFGKRNDLSTFEGIATLLHLDGEADRLLDADEKADQAIAIMKIVKGENI